MLKYLQKSSDALEFIIRPVRPAQRQWHQQFQKSFFILAAHVYSFDELINKRFSAFVCDDKK